MKKLAVLRNNEMSPCPFGLSIPFGCKNAGSLIHQLQPIDQSQNSENIKKTNLNKVEQNPDKSKCEYAGNIIENKFVDCHAPKVETSFPKGSPRFYRPMGGVGLEGLNTVPMGFYNDNSIDRGYYYGMYSIESISNLRKEYYNTLEKISNKKTYSDYINILQKTAGQIEAWHCGYKDPNEEFSLSHLGNGEGMNYLGPGIYFSSNENIAKSYSKYSTHSFLYHVSLVNDSIYNLNRGTPLNLRDNCIKLQKIIANELNIPEDKVHSNPDSFKYGNGFVGFLHWKFGKNKCIELLKSAGINGTCEILPNSVEYCIFDPSLITILDIKEINTKNNDS